VREARLREMVWTRKQKEMNESWTCRNIMEVEVFGTANF
jgi:hypothetical protein